MSRRAVALSSLIVAATLSACVVVPVDPRTGQPYPLSQPMNNSAPVTVINTPPPPQPAVLTARLYPLNAQAQKAGMLTALVVDQQGGRGSFNVSYLGDGLQGEATRVEHSYASFGRVHTEVLGPLPPNKVFSGQRGIANGYGARGISVQCEYLLNGPARGTGVCLFSDGAQYQMHFGG